MTEATTTSAEPSARQARPPQAISRLRVPPEAELPSGLREVFDGIRRKSGYVPNFVTALSANPATIGRLLTFYGDLSNPAGSLLTDVERELVSTVSSRATGCSYCVFFHRPLLAQALGDDVLADRIARNHEDVALAPREQAIADLAQKLALSPHDVSTANFAHLASLGLSEAAILEVLEIAAFHAYANRLTIALNVLPDPQLFERA
ncbi:MAG: hypothetical protein GAK30_00329 [Paracidovorax wautersii]|uniref:Carboxymuconolactone decarboxylase-like domain-containing protein n=1 Tax=Paracidovorax wautersii TaxID=1177982 RepID=A0A7V8JRQ3_9BURK|nr:MAG: hypothetical protein GAK30_00329 [Paracidovorax wautersii]